MKQHWHRPLTWAIIAVCLGLALGAGIFISTGRMDVQALFSGASAPPLVNPGFEDGFYLSGGVGELEIGSGWQAWYDPSTQHHRPEYKPEKLGLGKGRVHSGTFAQKLFTTYSSHDGGVYQEVYGVQPGQWYRFSMWAYQWSSSENNPDVSVRDGKCSAIAGINPWGDANVLYRTTIWGKEALQVYNTWVQVDVVAQAWSDRIVVALRHTCEWPVEHNDVYVDDARLELASVDSIEPPTPPPTYTPYPTYTPAQTRSCPTVEPGQTPAPGVEIDYALIREIVATVVAEREPVRWPR